MANPIQSTPRVLEPHERISEVLFGLIMVLTFTGSLRVALADLNKVRAMLIGALGCNLAWGIIDAVFYLMSCHGDRGRNQTMFLTVRNASDPEQARQLIGGTLPPLIASLLEPAELEMIRQRLLQLPEPRRRSWMTANDWLGALGVFLLVFLSTFPVAAPFVLMHDISLALKVSNAIAIIMLFLTGFAYGHSAGRSPWLFGIAMVIIGVLLVGLTMALGG